VPPTAYQPLVASSDFRLQTNDTRVLSAFIHQGDIQYVQSSILLNEIKSGIYHGVIRDVASAPSVNGAYIESSTLDYAYPSIAFVGETSADKNAAFITFSHVGESDYAGTSAVYYNRGTDADGVYSEVVRVKNGDSVINTFVADTAERWGDYTDIQPKYNEAGVAWLCGSYGDSTGRNNVWLAKIRVNEKVITVDKIITYPNPAINSVCVVAEFSQDDIVNIRLTDTRGTIVKELTNEEVRAGASEFLLNISGVSSGAYVLTIINDKDELLHSQKIIVE
jgi:hypothetical protein